MGLAAPYWNLLCERFGTAADLALTNLEVEISLNSNFVAQHRRELRTAIGAAIMTILGLFAGCGSDGGDRIRSDAIRYSSSLSRLSGLEVEAGNAFKTVIGENFTDVETLRATLLNQVIPKYQEFLDGLEKIAPVTDEIAEIHEKFTEGANDQMAGFNLIMTSANEGGIKLEKARITMQDALKEVADLIGN